MRTVRAQAIQAARVHGISQGEASRARSPEALIESTRPGVIVRLSRRKTGRGTLSVYTRSRVRSRNVRGGLKVPPFKVTRKVKKSKTRRTGQLERAKGRIPTEGSKWRVRSTCLSSVCRGVIPKRDIVGTTLAAAVPVFIRREKAETCTFARRLSDCWRDGIFEAPSIFELQITYFCKLHLTSLEEEKKEEEKEEKEVEEGKEREKNEGEKEEHRRRKL